MTVDTSPTASLAASFWPPGDPRLAVILQAVADCLVARDPLASARAIANTTSSPSSTLPNVFRSRPDLLAVTVERDCAAVRLIAARLEADLRASGVNLDMTVDRHSLSRASCMLGEIQANGRDLRAHLAARYAGAPLPEGPTRLRILATQTEPAFVAAFFESETDRTARLALESADAAKVAEHNRAASAAHAAAFTTASAALVPVAPPPPPPTGAWQPPPATGPAVPQGHRDLGVAMLRGKVFDAMTATPEEIQAWRSGER